MERGLASDVQQQDKTEQIDAQPLGQPKEQAEVVERATEYLVQRSKQATGNTRTGVDHYRREM